jgi:hypothetical protein
MENVTELLPTTASIDQPGRITANVAAPAFFAGAVAAFTSVLISRTNRVIDRSRFIHGISDGDSTGSFLKMNLSRLKRRVLLLNRALFCSILSAILTALIIIVAFISALPHVAHGVAILFTAALLMFCACFVDLARETRIALHDNGLRILSMPPVDASDR